MTLDFIEENVNTKKEIPCTVHVYVHIARRDHGFSQYFLELDEYGMHQFNCSSGIMYAAMYNP